MTTGTFELTPASELGPTDLAALLTRAYEGYEVPMHVDAGALVFMQEAFDLVLERSLVARSEGRAVGVAMLGVRGDRGWVGGMGVASEARRHGAGEQLMRALLASAREAGVRRVQLEVLERNDSARALYEKLGFRTLRKLEVYAWEQLPPADGARAEVSEPRVSRRRIAAVRLAPEPWQRADETIDRLDVSTPALRAMRTAGGDAVYRVTDGRAAVLQLAAESETAAGVLLDSIRTRAGVNVLRYLNVPADDVAAAALRKRGATLGAAQFEMALEL